MFALFNWKMDEKVNSAFVVFDLVGGNAGFEIKGDYAQNAGQRRCMSPEDRALALSA